MSRILVIRLGALGDFVLSFGPFAAIRAAHPYAEITLLTTAPFAGFARAAPWFDRVVVDTRPRPWDVPGLLRLRRALRGFHRVYDLQTSDRSGWYFRLAGRPDWSGIAPGCSLPHANPRRDTMHTVDRQRDQLAMAGLTRLPQPDVDWLRRPTVMPGLDPGIHAVPTSPGAARVRTSWPSDPTSPPAPIPGMTAVLIPGAAPHRPRKRWPADRFGALAACLAHQGRRVLVVGTTADSPHAATIRAACPAAIDLTGRTTLLQLARTLAGASLAIGNDTGPTHLAATLGIPTIALFSADSDPALTAPRGDVTILSEPDLADLTVARVAASLPPVHASRLSPVEAL